MAIVWPKFPEREHLQLRLRVLSKYCRVSNLSSCSILGTHQCRRLAGLRFCILWMPFYAFGTIDWSTRSIQLLKCLSPTLALGLRGLLLGSLYIVYAHIQINMQLSSCSSFIRYARLSCIWSFTCILSRCPVNVTPQAKWSCKSL